MQLTSIDFLIIFSFFVIVISIGWLASRTAGQSTAEYFLGGRDMPWWLLGISMVACTFAADTPNLVTGMVRENGVAKNWAWWAFLITGMITVFIYAKLWRRSKVMTDLEFYEKRYGGKSAAFLRGFRAIYLGFFFNVLIMASVTLAAIKIGTIMFNLEPLHTVLIASVAVVIYTSLGGLKGVLWADFFQYSIAMGGSVYAAYVALNQPEIIAIGGMSGIIEQLGEMTSFFPDFASPNSYIPLLIIPIAVQWWSVWYPGAEPGGGGYIAQRMLSAKDEKNALGATLLFNFAHYALRPWPWIIVALASMIIYPDLASIRAHFPNISDTYLKDDIAYPVMLSKLTPGWLGVVLASLIAAYMSTIGTHLNWGSSYLVHDFYHRFINPNASEKKLVMVARLSTLLLMTVAATLALTVINNATQAFNILLLSGAGSGAIYLLRWFWWRINAWTEIVAMISATIVAFILVLGVPDASVATEILDGFTMKLLIAVGFNSIVWLLVTFITKPENSDTLKSFYLLTQPGGPGWRRIKDEIDASDVKSNLKAEKWDMPILLLCVFVGCIVIYSSLFAIGSFVYGYVLQGSLLGAAALIGTFILFRQIDKIKFQ